MTKTSAVPMVRTLAEELNGYRDNLLDMRSRLTNATTVAGSDRDAVVSRIDNALTRIDPAQYESFDLRTVETLYQEQRAAVLDATVLLSKTVNIHG